MASIATASHLPALEEPHAGEAADEFVDAWRELADSSRLRPVAQASIEDHKVVRGLTDRIARASELARKSMDRLGDADLASQDVPIEVVRKLEEQQWMVRTQLVGRS